MGRHQGNRQKKRDKGYELNFDYNRVLKPSFVDGWLDATVKPLAAALSLSVDQLVEGQINTGHKDMGPDRFYGVEVNYGNGRRLRKYRESTPAGARFVYVPYPDQKPFIVPPIWYKLSLNVGNTKQELSVIQKGL
ncbi:hypothetical protein JCM33374_g631 [Metschnikowia sp. JCM 33374]|nr:hypothetical protein JCM33374_g631 [Metschnikowia sp. JCM 33374]